MEKPIIYLCEKLNKDQIERIESLAKNYQVIDATKTHLSINENKIEIMLGWEQRLGTRLLNSPASNLKWIQSISAGIDSFDLSLLEKKNILLSNTSGIHSTSIAEHVIGVLLSESRGIRTSIKNQAKHEWKRTAIAYQQLSGQKMLVVGTGHLGKQLAQLSQAFGIQTYGINTSGHTVSEFIECYAQENIVRIIGEMDIVVNILPLTDKTYHFYNKSLFAAMKTQAMFVNVGRGPSVNTLDLIEAISHKKLRFVALDVFEDEPLAKESPLWAMENVLITPHISGLTPKFKTLLLSIFLPNLQSFVTNGSLQKNQISFQEGY